MTALAKKWDGHEMGWARNGTGTKWDGHEMTSGTKWDSRA